MPAAPTDAQLTDLVAKAAKVRENAHAKYSNYPVGAALLTTDGKVFVGVNVENASYGLTICAERTAIAAAVTAGYQRGDFAAIAVVTRDAGAPCGACRQFMHEFGDMTVVLATADGSRPAEVSTVEALLPKAFRFRDA